MAELRHEVDLLSALGQVICLAVVTTSHATRPRMMRPSADGLEPRWMLSTASIGAPVVQMISATTADSKSVTIDYHVRRAARPRKSHSIWHLSLQRRQFRFKRLAC